MFELAINRLIKTGRSFFAVIIFLVFSTGIGHAQGGATASPDMIKVPGGEHKLFFSNESGLTTEIEPFILDVTAVTNADFLEFVKTDPQWSRSRVSKIYADTGYLKHWQGDMELGAISEKIKNSPVTNISWFAANDYCKKQGKRLPTVDEWEYAASSEMAGSDKKLTEIILEWYSKPTPKVMPPVRSTMVNEFGLYDMHGLVWEWTSDFNSVVMGGDSRSNDALKETLFCASGSFGAADKEDYASFMRYAYRSSLKANYTVANLGFRCASDIKKK